MGYHIRCHFSKQRQHSEETKRKIALGVKNYHKKNSPPVCKEPLKTLKQLSKRTVSKVFMRMGLGCSRCGWNEAVCDLHHIRGRKIEDCDAHTNLSYLCPNCHRLVHSHKIDSSELVSLFEQIGDTWKDYYYWKS